MIMVTGATGNLGRPLVAELAAQGKKVRALTRTPERADLPAGVYGLSLVVTSVGGSPVPATGVAGMSTFGDDEEVAAGGRVGRDGRAG